jgi:TrmH family RNA methyltransferase
MTPRWQSVAEMIRRVESARGRRRAGLYAVEGTRLVERALRAGAPLTAVLTAAHVAATPDARHRALFDALRAAGCPVVVAPDEVVVELTAGRDLGHVLGLVRLPEEAGLEALLERVSSDERRVTSEAAPVFLAAVDITDPGNVGALTRTAHAAGAAALLVAGASDPFHPRATRTSRGSIFRLPVVAYGTAAGLLADLRRCGVAALAAVAEGGVPLPNYTPPGGPLAVLMGNEAEGLPPDVAAAVDARLTIPMTPGVDSYSVNAAAAIVLYTIQHGRFDRQD